jgi:hypothetical protein
MSEIIAYRGRGLMHGGYAQLACDDLDRATVELLLASWFAWLGDRAAITIAPAGERQAAELRIRRWKTRPGVVLFRWRNADETRASFHRVHESFRAAHARFDLELTPKTKKPRALAITLDADDVFSPAGAVGLANRAFAAAGFPGCTRYDLTCAGPVLRKGTRPCALIPQSRAYQAGSAIGRVLGRIIGRGIWWIRRAVDWGRGRD